MYSQIVLFECSNKIYTELMEHPVKASNTCSDNEENGKQMLMTVFVDLIAYSVEWTRDVSLMGLLPGGEGDLSPVLTCKEKDSCCCLTSGREWGM